MPTRTQFESEAEWLAHLRLWFAGKALGGILACNLDYPETNGKKSGVAAVCYLYADAMITERSKP